MESAMQWLPASDSNPAVSCESIYCRDFGMLHACLGDSSASALGQRPHFVIVRVDDHPCCGKHKLIAESAAWFSSRKPERVVQMTLWQAKRERHPGMFKNRWVSERAV